MIWYALGALAAIGITIACYYLFAPGPRRWRAYQRARRLLDGGAWQEALALTAYLRAGRLNPTWQGRLRNLAGECHQLAIDETLKEKAFEEALEHALDAADLLGLNAAEQRGRIVEASLADVRRLFAQMMAGGASEQGDPTPVLTAIDRTARLAEQLPPEGVFWRALTLVRQGDLEGGLAALTTIYDVIGRQVVDVPLYLGILMFRLGKPQEALRYLAEANRVDSNCPVVPWQMGVALVASNGDSGLAVRALQRAIGNRGLTLWIQQQERLWLEGFPEGRSYIRRLATRHRFICPLLGSDLRILLRQGQLALAQAYYRQDRFQEAADLYDQLLKSSPPTVMLLRGYGLSLARLKRYDEAYKQLRLALEQENPKDPFTAGYLALCGAMGKPTNEGDKPKNIAWALRLLSAYPASGDAEWAGIVSEVHAEARLYNLHPALADQVLLCDTLAAVADLPGSAAAATDAKAAAAFAHLTASHPEAVKPVYAWLYVRAATANGYTGAQDLAMFARTFQVSAEARAYFDAHQWDFKEAEYTYLERAAKHAPGRFPAALGGNYRERGEAFLLARSKNLEKEGKKTPARDSAEVLLRLAPDSVAAHDRLACLHYRAGEVDRAVELLDGWRKLAPADHWPLVRQAIIEQERGNASRRSQVINDALGLTQGRLRSEVAMLGARLAIRACAKGWANLKDAPVRADAGSSESLLSARDLLQACLQDQPEHTEALWCLAAVRSILGEREALAAQAPLMDRPTVTDARFHFLGAVCHLAAGDYRRVIDAGARAAQEQALATESKFLVALANIRLGELDVARTALSAPAADEKSPSVAHARALLGNVNYQRGAYDDAIRWWNQVEATSRAKWGLDAPLQQIVLLAGLAALEEGRYESAADRFREAAKLGLRDRRIGGLITYALVKAGQKLLYSV